jgi:hypothetical protein
MLDILFWSMDKLLLEEGLECSLSWALPLLPPRIADTEDCPSLPCFRIADVMVTHSVVISATGFTVIDMAIGSGISRRLPEIGDLCKPEISRSALEGDVIWVEGGIEERDVCVSCVAAWFIFELCS